MPWLKVQTKNVIEDTEYDFFPQNKKLHLPILCTFPGFGEIGFGETGRLRSGNSLPLSRWIPQTLLVCKQTVKLIEVWTVISPHPSSAAAFASAQTCENRSMVYELLSMNASIEVITSHYC